MKKVFKISGMQCHSCAMVIKLGLEDVKGVDSAEVDFNSAQARLEFDENRTDFSKIKNVIKELGYKAVE